MFNNEYVRPPYGRPAETSSLQSKLRPEIIKHNYAIKIAGLQSIPGDLKYKDVAAMLVVQTREANEEWFVIGHQLAAMTSRANQQYSTIK